MEPLAERESASELIKRLTKEFHPLPVRNIARCYLATGRPFRAHEFVLVVTRAWRDFQEGRAQ